ncbi:HEPACAM family member 2-like [Conger conger]|uniref:HEPACAM family member 2-like n=1 Tax=Conger conger TaxID=82655 RepID=UPI002A5A35A4|nr:HEPACAM family member 2-like [Conger conger]
MLEEQSSGTGDIFRVLEYGDTLNYDPYIFWWISGIGPLMFDYIEPHGGLLHLALGILKDPVILLYTCWSAGVCVSAQSTLLNSIVGETVTFPTAVKEFGFIWKGDLEIAIVTHSVYHVTNSSYGKRLQWDSSSGLFSITGLRRQDAGDYRVLERHRVSKHYQLAVWDPVPRPQVSSRSRVKPSCSVLCSVENGRELTLSWHREGRILSYTSSPNLSTPLSLRLEIEGNSAPYSCVAENPARKEIFLVKPEEYCYGSVWKPHIKTSASQGGRSCSLQCSVQNGRELILSWRTEGETLSHTRDPNLSTLSLTLEIEASNSTYTCVATNPVNEERTAFLPTQVCGQEGHRPHDAVLYVMFVLRLVEFVLVTVAVVVLLHLYHKVLTQNSTERRGRRRYQEADTAL